MKLPRILTALAALACHAALTLPLSAAPSPVTTVASPDGTLVFQLESDPESQALTWSATFGGRPLVTHGALGIRIDGVGDVGGNGTIGKVETGKVDAHWEPPYGENRLVSDRYNSARIAINQPGQSPLAVTLEVRAYDEGIAFRYSVAGKQEIKVVSEATSFPLPAQTVVWRSMNAQGKIARQPLNAVKGVVERPLTAELAKDLFIALGEAGLVNQARMKFAANLSDTLVASLDGASEFKGGYTSPWRYVRAAKSPAGLLSGNAFLLNLNEPSKIADVSWLRPGKVLREVTLTTRGAMAAIDFAAAHNLQFILFDAGWYGHEYDDKADARAVNVDPKRSPGPLDLQAVIAYGKSKNVGVILYVNRRALERQLDTLLPLYKKWGVAGIKFGFVNVGPQKWTAWLHESIAKCAKYNLMVDVHDEYRMTGVERTYPNFLTAEGVRGEEESPLNEEVLKTIFTRGLAGAADQTNCYFAERVKKIGSHASQLAKAVCIYSPWQHLFWYDRPPGASEKSGAGVSIIQDVPEMVFFERLPTTWDETRWLDGHPETHAIVARRKGDTWFIGVLNGAAPREFDIPLDFLEKGRAYQMQAFSDDPAVATPTNVRVDLQRVDSKSRIKRMVAARNGFAAIISPVSKNQ